MGSWVGPAVVAALIAALVSAAGWFVTTRQALALERARRRERTRDFQIALRAEIFSELANLVRPDLDAQLARMAERLETDAAHAIFVPSLPRNLIFEAIVADLPILPEHVLGPLVFFTRQRQVMDGLVKDIRSEEFRSLPKSTQLEIYREYWELWTNLRDLAQRAVDALADSR